VCLGGWGEGRGRVAKDEYSHFQSPIPAHKHRKQAGAGLPGNDAVENGVFISGGAVEARLQDLPPHAT
jgi:hypothetical protein